MERFFSKEVQDVFKADYGDVNMFAHNVCFSPQYFYERKDDLAYKSYYYKIASLPFASHLAWIFPRYKKEIMVSIAIDSSTNDEVVEDTETGFVLDQPKGSELAYITLPPGEKGLFVSKDWFKLSEDKYKSISLRYTRGEDYSYKDKQFILKPCRGFIHGDKDTTDYRNEHDFYEDADPIGWSALHGEVVDSHTIRVSMTDALYDENMDFNNLVLTIRFSESLEDCQVGFSDIPGYFGAIASGKTHEEIIEELMDRENLK